MHNQTSIASAMLCQLPKIFNSRAMLSVSDSVWEPVDVLPMELKKYFTDEVGNHDVTYGGFLQLTSPKALELISDHDLFLCFRCIAETYLAHVQVCPPTRVYQRLVGDLRSMGWDISTGNGWLSASCHGHFPVDPFSGDTIDDNILQINKFGLFNNLDDCLKYCEINNSQIPEHALWFPVEIKLDVGSYSRLENSL